MVLLGSQARASNPFFQGLLHDRHTSVHRARNRKFYIVGQEVSGPCDRADARGNRNDLDRRIVVPRCAAFGRPDYAARPVVDGHDRLPHDSSVPERDYPRRPFDPSIDNEAGNETGVQGANVADGVPNVVGGRSDLHFSGYGRQSRSP